MESMTITAAATHVVAAVTRLGVDTSRAVTETGVRGSSVSAAPAVTGAGRVPAVTRQHVAAPIADLRFTGGLRPRPSGPGV